MGRWRGRPHLVRKRRFQTLLSLEGMLAERDGNVYPHAPVGERLLERGNADAFLLLAFHGVIEQYTRVEDVNLPVRKHLTFRQEGGVRALERIRKAEAQDHTRSNGEKAHDSEQPKPPRLPADAPHMQDTICKEL